MVYNKGFQMTNAAMTTTTITDITTEVAMTFAIAKDKLTSFMKGVVGKKSKNKRALNRIHMLIAQSKTEVMCAKREVILFELLEELENEIARL